MTLFNGQTAGIGKFLVGKDRGRRHALLVQPVISADRRNVRLNLRISDRNSPWNETRAYVNTVPDGKMLLIEIGQRKGNEVGVPIITMAPYVTKLFKNTGVRRSEGPQFLLTRPRVIVHEEEEELRSKRLTKFWSTVTPRGLFSGEEEELLGIEK